MKYSAPFRKTPLVLAIAASLASPILVQAAPGDPLGPEFRVSGGAFPAVAMDAEGNFVVAWQNVDQSGIGIYAQRYDRAGVAQGTEFQVNTYTTLWQSDPAVAIDADGDFVVAWTSYDQDGDHEGIFAQRYDRAGVAQGGEFQVNTFTTDQQINPAVAMDAEDNFVVAWESCCEGGPNYGVFAQRYNRGGVAQGPEFRVNTFFTTGGLPTVAIDADGDFVVAWVSYFQDGDYGGIFAQRYNRAGMAQGAEFQVNTYTTNSQLYPTVAMDADGDFVVAWQSRSQDGSDWGIYAQRYNHAGVAQGTEFQVNTFTTDQQWLPTVAMDATGDFVVAWDSDQDGDGPGIYAQRYAGPAAGGPLTTVGLYDPAASRFYLRNSHAGGPADTTFRFGPGGLGWPP